MISHGLTHVHEHVTDNAGHLIHLLNQAFFEHPSQWVLMVAVRPRISPDKISLSIKPSDMGRNTKLGWFEGLGELNLGCAIVIEKPLE